MDSIIALPHTYHRIADVTLDQIMDNLEVIGDETDLAGFDLEYSQGVLTLRLGEHGTYVLNKQPPNKQIWLSSPKSGPKRYDYDIKEHKWFYHRDNHTMDELLNEELKDILGDLDVLAGLATEDLE
ncbi:Frataxin [Hesseltinella vesiculosa]|uniref:ferroxidase n=1 Tax=Hesseltinella vesiculosa TaxID=101127 RepID=A0A1X2GA77_9FUNG|nr:Frataxin [Hesseltinella vesiculosa]